MSTDNFYAELEPFSRFDDFTDASQYKKVPDDWWIIVADIKGSTQAVEEGRYKDVNIIGAAAIVCVRNTVGDLEFPFVFGGDGATILLPNSQKKVAEAALVSLKSLAARSFNLDLRVGAIPIPDVGATIEIGKYQIAPGQNIAAILSGKGVQLAEGKIKADKKYQCELSYAPLDAPLHGLSCRWQPVRSVNGEILSLIVNSNVSDSISVFGSLIKQLRSIFDGEFKSGNPIKQPLMKYKSLFQILQDELKLDASVVGRCARFTQTLLAIFLFKLGFHRALPAARRYWRAIPLHSDFQKFDGNLRMVLDCTPDQIVKIEALLQSYFECGEINYGVHRSKEALMTCFVTKLEDGGHIHFVDGGFGGYTLAAKAMKTQARLKALAS